MTQEESEMEVAIKVVAIMQTITEELDESTKKMWRKIFGIPDRTKSSNLPSQERKSKEM